MLALNPTLFRHLLTSCLVAGIASTVAAQNPELPLPPDAGDFANPADGQGVESEILTRGPVHEAFAEQYVSDPQPGLIVNQVPPEPIDELPPEEMPEGDNVEWIPGYWAFDEDLDDFIWISGFWRDIPLGQRWVPGYWNEVPEGSQWVSGFWTSSDGEELAYLPQPPGSLEQGPNVAPPGGDHFWVPGMWVYHNYDYRWRPGYYTQSRGDYVWIPARYRWTPRGYVFCSGYWDYPLVRRGTLFSPVYFHRHRFPRRYRPRYTVAFEPLLIHLFACPRYNHYYFGDYYANRYRARGIIPFVRINTFGNRRYFHDPLFAYYHMPTRRNTFDRLVNWNRYFDRNTDLRPPRTLNATQQFARGKDRGQAGVKQAIVSVPIDELRRSTRSPGSSFRSISEETRNKISQEARESVRKLTESRVRFEARRNDENRGQNGNLGPNGRPDQPERPIRNGRPDQIGRPDLADRSSRDDRTNRLDSFRLPDTPKLQSRSRDNLSSQQRDTFDRLRNQSSSRFDSSPAGSSDRGPRINPGQTRNLQIPNRGRSDSPTFDFNPRDTRGRSSDRSFTPRSDMAPGFQRGGNQPSDRSSTPRSFSNPGNGPSPRSFTPRNLNAVPGSNSDAGRQRSFSLPDRSSSDRGSFNRSIPDRGSTNRSTPDRSPTMRSVPDRGSSSRSTPDRGSFSRSTPDRGSSIRSTPDRGSSSRSSSDRGSSNRGSSKGRGSGSKKK